MVGPECVAYVVTQEGPHENYRLSGHRDEFSYLYDSEIQLIPAQVLSNFGFLVNHGYPIISILMPEGQIGYITNMEHSGRLCKINDTFLHK